MLRSHFVPRWRVFLFNSFINLPIPTEIKFLKERHLLQLPALPPKCREDHKPAKLKMEERVLSQLKGVQAILTGEDWTPVPHSLGLPHS